MRQTASGARGLSASMTLAGPPDRMIALGAQAASPRGVRVERPDLAVDSALAQAPGDQLGDLAAEIQDEHPLVMLADVRHSAFQHSLPPPARYGRRRPGARAGNPVHPPVPALGSSNARGPA